MEKLKARSAAGVDRAVRGTTPASAVLCAIAFCDPRVSVRIVASLEPVGVIEVLATYFLNKAKLLKHVETKAVLHRPLR